MEYIIVDKPIIISNVTYGDFLNVTELTENSVSVNISNNESMTYTISIVNNDIQTSVNDYFNNLSS